MNGERNHLLKFLDKGIRFDGRKLDEFRELSVETGVSKTAEGSAKVILGETIVMAGIKMAVETPYPDTPDQGTLMVNAELLPMSNPEFESGPPSVKAIELARVVDRGIRESHAIDFKKLCIEEGEKAWTVIIDIMAINDAGNLLDASAIAAMAALKDTLFPKFDGGNVDYKEKTKEGLPLQKEPLAVTVFKIGDKFIVDPLSEEEKLIDARLTIASEDGGTLCALQKGGDIAVTTEDISAMFDIALARTKEIREKIKG